MFNSEIHFFLCFLWSAEIEGDHMGQYTQEQTLITTVLFPLCVSPVCSLYIGQTGVLTEQHPGVPGLPATSEVLQLHQAALHSAAQQPYYLAVTSRI